MYMLLDESVQLKIIFLISQPRHMLWVLKRTIIFRVRDLKIIFLFFNQNICVLVRWFFFSILHILVC